MSIKSITRSMIFTMLALFAPITSGQAQTCDIICKLEKTEGLSSEQRVSSVCSGDNSKLCNLLRTDKAYRDQYLKTADTLNNALRSVAVSIAQAEAESERARKALAELRARAPTTQDGTAVFRGDDGVYYTEDGKPLIISEESKKYNFPAYAHVASARQAQAKARSRIVELEAFKKKLER